ncbi:hypothetical protein FSP39_020526 [Pinctada imbricata]|uniref:Major facilitator superfamily (MFS) profile domain-containing protein n=1 Tax=Pinctada imbricata TaxID=66713 RepID=A0AA89C1U5_PINIB|nr:hypothetical protein FSP39_020526 [Pinctada imbricata]
MELFTCRQCVIAGGILLSLAHGSSSFVGNIQTLYLTYGTFLGFGIALSFSSVMVMVGTYFDKRRGLANGLVMASGSLGTLLLGPGIRYLIDEYTLKGALIIVCGLCTHVVASGAAMRPISFYYYKKTKINKEKVKDVEINKSSNDALLNDVIHSETVVYKGAWRDSPIVVRRRSMSESAHNKPIKTYVSDDKLFSLSIADLRVYSNEESESENSENDSCLKNLKKKIVKVFDYRILKRGPFIRMLLAYMAGSLAVSTPIFYLPAYAEEQGLSKQDAAILISIYGCIDVIGRMSAGALSDVGIIKRQYLIGLGLLLNGVTQCLALFYQDFWTFVVYVSLYGLFGGVMPALYVSRLIEMLGLDLLRSGLLLMYMGQGASLGIMSPLIAGIIAVTLVEGVQKSFGILYVEFIVKFHATDAETSAIQTAYNVSFSIGSILTLAVAMEKLSCRQCVIAGGLILALGPGLSLFAKRIFVLYLTYGCFIGLGASTVFSSTLVILGTYFDRRRGLANGFVQAAGSLGTLALGPVIRAILDEYGLNGTLLILCGIITHIAAAGAVMRPISFYQRKEVTVDKSHELQRDTSALLNVGKSMVDETSKSHETLFRDSFQNSPAMFRKRSMSIIKCFGLFLIEFLELFKEGVTKTVVIYTLINATYGILSIFVLSYGLRRFSARQIGFVGCLLCTVGFIISSFAESLSFLIFSIGIVVGCGGSLVFSPVFVMLGHYFDKRRGLANGVCASGSCIGGLVFPPLMRNLLDNYGLRGSLILIGGIYSNIFIFICLLRPLNFYKRKLKVKEDKCISLLIESEFEEIENKNGTNKAFKEKNSNGTDKAFKEKELNGKDKALKENDLNGKITHVNGPKKHSGFTSLVNMSTISNSELSIASYRKRTFSERANQTDPTESNGIKSYMSNHSLMTTSSFGDPDWKDIVPPDKEENMDKSNTLFSLFKNAEFVLFILYNGFGSISGGLSYTFVPLFAKDFGLTNDQVVIVLLIMGVCDFIGRIVCGLIADLPQVRTIYIILLSQLIVGVVANCAVLLTSYWNFCLFVVGYGLFCGINFSLGPGLLSRIVGLEKFPLAFSISIISQQIGLGGSSPLLGYFRDTTGDYYTSFHILGLSAFIAVILIASGQIFRCMRKLE